MQPTPITALSPIALRPVTPAGESGVRRVPAVAREKEPTPPLPIIGSNVLVEFARHRSGADVVKFVDKRTGETINQLPAEQVLDAVSALIEMVKKREAEG